MTLSGNQRMAGVAALIGAGWAIYAAQALTGAMRATAIVASGLIAIAIIVRILVDRRTSPNASRRRPDSRRVFVLAVIGEIVLLNIAAQILLRIGRMDLLIPAISFVVGLHFLPLAWGYGDRRFLSIGGAMIAGAITAFALIAQRHWSAAAIGAVESLVNALILWGAALSRPRGAKPPAHVHP